MSENKMRLKRETHGAFCVRKRKITNAKIYEDKRDLYCRTSEPSTPATNISNGIANGVVGL